ncbi:hypothetical protein RIF29_41229 [Crotalaria pallida]|uniref:Uncharacterized protein n=1 Tax=Crotalaria pallida TaxID=3830 RepID=A0AAN9HSG5_CROPI
MILYSDCFTPVLILLINLGSFAEEDIGRQGLAGNATADKGLEVAVANLQEYCNGFLGSSLSSTDLILFAFYMFIIEPNDLRMSLRVLEQRITALLDKLLVKPSLVTSPSMEEWGLLLDTSGSVKLWEITKGVVVEDYGKVSFEEKKEELFEMFGSADWLLFCFYPLHAASG